jgi:DNA-binding NarL/FixJ family response regulator
MQLEVVSAAAHTVGKARVVLLAGDNWFDITDATVDLLHLARIAAPKSERPRDPDKVCPASLAVLCQQLGHCNGRCYTSSTAPGPSTAQCGKLTGRESQVVAHVRQGLTNKEIARRLGIQEDTVKKHMQAVFEKLGVHRRVLVAIGRISPN